MTKAQTMWMAVLVLTASCLAVAEQPVVWYPAQQTPDTQSSQTASGQAGQQPTTETGQQPTQQPGAQPVQPGTQPAQPGTQPAQPGVQPGVPPNNDPRADQPMQPIAPAESASTTTQQAPTVAPMVPDTTPLNSPQELTLGASGGGTRNYLAPSFRVSQFVDDTTGIPNGGTMAVTTLAGTAQLVHNWSRVNLALDYSAGGTIFPTNSDFNSWFQTAGVSTSFHIQRWALTLNDSASYMPESSFGYYGTSGLPSSSLGVGYVPNQSILTQNSPRISNTAALTLQRPLTARSSLHFSASWGILRFQGGPFINTDYVEYSGGYDHSIGIHNTLGFAYSGGLYTFGGSDRSITTRGVNIAYGRRITGRLALQVSAGPQVSSIEDPAFLSSDTQATWNARAGLIYSTRKLSLSSSFSRGTNSGAGVTGGTETYQWQTSIVRQIGRVWSGTAGFGYAHNSTLQQGLVAERHFNTEYASLQIYRPLGREASLFLSYNYQHQTSDIPLCLGCGESFDRHVIGVGFEWHKRPMVLGF